MIGRRDLLLLLLRIIDDHACTTALVLPLVVLHTIITSHNHGTSMEELGSSSGPNYQKGKWSEFVTEIFWDRFEMHDASHK